MKIRQKITLGFVGIALLIGLLGYICLSASQKVLQEAIGRSSASLAIETMDKIDRSISDRIESLQIYGTGLTAKKFLEQSNREFERLDDIAAHISRQDSQWTSAAPKTVTPFMQALLNSELSEELAENMKSAKQKRGHPVFAEIFITNKYGANVALTGRTTDYYQADEQWWQAAKDNGLYVGNIMYDENAKVYCSDIGIRIDGRDGDFLGVIKAVLSLEGVIRIIDEVEKSVKYDMMRLILTTADGRTLHSTEDFKFLEDASAKLIPRFGYPNQPEHKQYIITRFKNGHKALYAHAHSKGYSQYGGLGWRLIVEHDTDEIFASIATLRNTIVIISIAIITFALGVGIIASRSISAPIAKLTQATVEIGQGNLNTEVPVKSNDEIGQLAAAFDRMTKDLKETIGKLNTEVFERTRTERKLHNNNKFLDSVFDGIQDGISVLDTTLNITKVNAWMERAYADQMPLVGKKCYNAYQKRQSPCPWCPSLSVLQTGQKHTEIVQYPNEESPDGWMELSSFALRNAHGSIAGVIEHVKDITDHKQTEQTMEKLNRDMETTVRELSNSNKQMQDFVHVAVHDLKTPLRGIGTLADWIATDYADAFDEQGRQQIRLLLARVKRIDKLIDGMLQYSRIDRCREREHQVDLNQLLDEIIGEIDRPQHIEVTIENDLPTTVCEKRHIKQVFHNLLTNAIEYSDKPNAKIGIRCEEKSGLWEFAVSDNGPGIEEKHYERIFKIFQTLSADTELQSMGVGLALAKKITELYNGRIWVESEIGKGSTFFFTWPKSTVGQEAVVVTAGVNNDEA